MPSTRRILGTLLLCSGAAACSLATPPTCEDTETAACFKGAMRSLLGERLPDVEVCAPELEDIDCVMEGHVTKLIPLLNPLQKIESLKGVRIFRPLQTMHQIFRTIA